MTATRSARRRPPARPSGGDRNRSAAWIIAVVVALVVGIGIAALALGGRGGDDTAPAGEVVGPLGPAPVEVGSVRIDGDPLPTVPDGAAAPDPARGVSFPAMAGVDVRDGSPVSIGDDGRAKVVVFLAHWCPVCQREVPVITRWLEDNGAPESVDVYAVSTAVDRSRANYPPSEWLIGEGWDVPTLADSADSAAFQAAGLTSFPSFVVVAADGSVVGRVSGALTAAGLDALVEVAGTAAGAAAS